MTTETGNTPKDIFDIARAIAEVLSPLDAPTRTKALAIVYASIGMAPSETPLGSGAPPLPASGVASPAPTGQVTMKQFIDAKNPQSDRQLVAVVAYYHRFIAPVAERKESIGYEELKELPRNAGRAIPHRQSLHNAKAQGYLDSTSERGKFKISTVGENLVAVTLPGTAAPVARNGNKKKAKPASKPRKSSK